MDIARTQAWKDGLPEPGEIRATLNFASMATALSRTLSNAHRRVIFGIRHQQDGKEHPYTIRDGKHSSHTASCKILNERKLEIIENHDNGKVITTFLATISADGKTPEEAWSNKSEDGSPLSQDDRDWILDRQQSCASTGVPCMISAKCTTHHARS